MKFHKALKMLVNGDCRSIKNPKMLPMPCKQTLESISHWFCVDGDEETRKECFKKWVFSKDWEVDGI
jgi:hypothetical protein